LQFDPKGWLPLTIANFVGEYQPLRIAKIRSCLTQELRQSCKDPYSEEEAYLASVQDQLSHIQTDKGKAAPKVNSLGRFSLSELTLCLPARPTSISARLPGGESIWRGLAEYPKADL